MAAPSEPVGWYDAHAQELANAYEAVDPDRLHAWLVDLLPTEPSLVLDVGAGTGRDAAWFARRGHSVVAVEPAAAMRAEARARHPEAAISWVDDALPALNQVHRQGHAFHVILLSGVWQHVLPADRARARRKLLGLLRAGGMLALSLRQGAEGTARGMHPVSLDEVERLARAHGAMVERVVDLPDQQGRSSVSWTGVVLRLPDDGTGALPLLRHFILNDAKSATYKLGLLRAVCRAADGQAGLAHEQDEDTIVLPLGAIALNWLRLYLPLVTANCRRCRATPVPTGWASPGLLEGLVPRLDLRIGARFAGAQTEAVHAALQEAADLIAKMPATYITYPNGGPVLPTTRRRAPRVRGELVLDAEVLVDFGTLALPRTLWRAMGRFAAWVEPALIAEWMRLMRDYAARQERVLDEGAMAAAMTWAEPARDVALPRERAPSLLRHGEALHCVWSGRKLTAARWTSTTACPGQPGPAAICGTCCRPTGR